MSTADDDLRSVVAPFADAIPDLLWLESPAGEVTYGNVAWSGFTGLRAEATLSDMLAIVHPEERETAERRWSDAHRTRTPFTMEYRLRAVDHQYRWFRGTLAPHHDSSTWVGLAVDIDDLKTIRGSVDRARSLTAVAEALPQIVWIADGRGHMFFYNDLWYEATGLPRTDESSFEQWAPTVHPEDFERALATWRDCLTAQRPYEVELRQRRLPDGVYRWYLVRARPLAADHSGVVWFGTNTDIDGQKRFIESAERRAVQLRQIAESIPTLVWTARPNGYVDYYSQRFLAYAQASLEELLGWGWETIVHPDDLARDVATWSRALREGVAYENEVRVRRIKDGTYRWFLSRALPYVGIDGQIEAWFGTSTDIDDQKRLAQRRESVIETLVQAFMPLGLPAFAPYALDAVYIPAEEDARVGGDFYDTVVLPDGRLLFAIGDVAGHGIAAAVTMGRARNAIAATALVHDDPAEVLSYANRALRLYDETMVTAIVGFLDRERGLLRYATAGHPAPILVQRGTMPRLLPTHGEPLGIVARIHPRTYEERLVPGAMFFLYTDGILEYDRNLELGERKLLAAADAAVERHDPSRSIYHSLLGMRRAPDDVALLTITHHRAS